MAKSDFHRVSELIQKFCDSNHLQQVLGDLDSKKKVSGWEGWLQLEFAHFLHGRADIEDWRREARYRLNKQKSKKRSRAHLDFSIRWKHTDKKLRIGLELKAKYDFRTCFREMLKDWEKAEKIKKCEDNMRDFYVVGFHTMGKRSIEDIQAIISHETDIPKRHILCHPIGKTPFAVTLF